MKTMRTVRQSETRVLEALAILLHEQGHNVSDAITIPDGLELPYISTDATMHEISRALREVRRDDVIRRRGLV